MSTQTFISSGGGVVEVERLRRELDRFKDDFRQFIVDLQAAVPKGLQAVAECLRTHQEKIDAARAAEALK